MPRERTPPGESVASRLAARGRRAPLQRRSMAGGSEVFQGPLASRALQALGARAMTVDRSVVVGEDFDPGRIESQALLAHEQVHVAGSGGEGSSDLRDAEEIEARSAERMVHQRATGGATEAASGPAAESGAASPAGGDQGQASSAERGYQALQAEGLTGPQIVERLATACADRLDEEERTRVDRAGHLKGGF